MYRQDLNLRKEGTDSLIAVAPSDKQLSFLLIPASFSTDTPDALPAVIKLTGYGCRATFVLSC
jgi:hypothetical protein